MNSTSPVTSTELEQDIRAWKIQSCYIATSYTIHSTRNIEPLVRFNVYETSHTNSPTDLMVEQSIQRTIALFLEQGFGLIHDGATFDLRISATYFPSPQLCPHHPANDLRWQMGENLVDVVSKTLRIFKLEFERTGIILN